jgi:hypothetical protein
MGSVKQWISATFINRSHWLIFSYPHPKSMNSWTHQLSGHSEFMDWANTMLELQYPRIVLVFAFIAVSIRIYTYIYSILKFTCHFHNSSRTVVCISLLGGCIIVLDWLREMHIYFPAWFDPPINSHLCTTNSLSRKPSHHNVQNTYTCRAVNTVRNVTCHMRYSTNPGVRIPSPWPVTSVDPVPLHRVPW